MKNPTKYDAIISLVGGPIRWTDGSDVVEYLSGQTPPTEEAIQSKLAELQAEYPLQELRETRTRLLAETDWMANKDVTLPAAWKTYRQELRDLPSGLDTVDKVNAVTWPTKPS